MREILSMLGTIYKSFILEKKKLFPRVRVSICIISPMLIRDNIQFDRNIGKNIESLDNLNNAINETNHILGYQSVVSSEQDIQ